MINGGVFLNHGKRNYSIPTSVAAIANGTQGTTGCDGNATSGGGDGGGVEETEMPLLPRSKS